MPSGSQSLNICKVKKAREQRSRKTRHGRGFGGALSAVSDLTEDLLQPGSILSFYERSSHENIFDSSDSVPPYLQSWATAGTSVWTCSRHRLLPRSERRVTAADEQFLIPIVRRPLCQQLNSSQYPDAPYYSPPHRAGSRATLLCSKVIWLAKYEHCPSIQCCTFMPTAALC